MGNAVESLQINSQAYLVYADDAVADLYLGGAIHADTWRASASDVKKMALVTATRTLDRQRWKGTKNVSDQLTQWPRKGTGVSGVVDDSVPDDIRSASIELANALVNGDDVQNQSTTEEKIQSLKAGSVSITNFRNIGTSSRFPQIIQELIVPYLSAPDFGGVKTKGTHKESAFGRDGRDFGFTWPV